MSRRMTMQTLGTSLLHRLSTAALVLAAAGVPFATAPNAQGNAAAQPAPAASAPATDASGTPLPADYVIGPNDVLIVYYWRDKDMSAEVAVRPDGKITLPLLNDVQASGLTPEALRVRIAEAAARFVESPVVSVSVKAINSRKVYITG